MKLPTVVNGADDASNRDELMRTSFSDRDDLIAYLRSEFPKSVAIANDISPILGGRQAGLQLLQKISPAQYAKTRNHLDGAVTTLSPYIRHGILSLAEVRQFAFQTDIDPDSVTTFVKELGWRAYFQLVYKVLGSDIWQDLERYKTGHDSDSYAEQLPEDIRYGTTGLACIDAFSEELRRTGYLHNHQRLWLASYIIHWRRVRWQAGARWFLSHLLDGDPASNNLSWQWVASTFSHKPYIFNRENLERFAGDRYCRTCPLLGKCELDEDYETLSARLFPDFTDSDPVSSDVRDPARQRLSKVELNAVNLTDQSLTRQKKAGDTNSPGNLLRSKKPLIWVHGDYLHPHSPARAQFPDAPMLWVWDDRLLERRKISLKRILFLYESLLELPVTIRRGHVVSEVLAYAELDGCDSIVTVESISPGFHAIVEALEEQIPVIVLRPEPLLREPMTVDLRRFSRYWRAVAPIALATP